MPTSTLVGHFTFSESFTFTGKTTSTMCIFFLFSQSFTFPRRFDTAELSKQLLGDFAINIFLKIRHSLICNNIYSDLDHNQCEISFVPLKISFNCLKKCVIFIYIFTYTYIFYLDFCLDCFQFLTLNMPQNLRCFSSGV